MEVCRKDDVLSVYTHTNITVLGLILRGKKTISDKGISIKMSILLLFLLTCSFVHIHTAACDTKQAAKTNYPPFLQNSQVAPIVHPCLQLFSNFCTISHPFLCLCMTNEPPLMERVALKGFSDVEWRENFQMSLRSFRKLCAIVLCVAVFTKLLHNISFFFSVWCLRVCRLLLKLPRSSIVKILV